MYPSYIIESTNLLVRLEENNIKEEKLCFCIVHSIEDSLINFKDQFLHPQELIQFHHFKFPLRKKSYLLGRFAAKKALCYYHTTSKEQDYFIINGMHGEPLLPNGNLFLSISHSGNWGVAVITSSLIKTGIDIETLENINDLDVSYFSQADLELFYKAKEDEKKHHINGYLWTIRESLVKFLQLGFSLPFNLLELESVRYNSHSFIVTFSNFKSLHAIAIKYENFIIALCLPKIINLENIQSIFKKVLWSHLQNY